MKVHICKRIYLESDKRQFLLNEYSGKTDKEGKETYKTIGFYDTLPQAIRKLYKLKVGESTAKNLAELVQDHKRIIKEVEDLLGLKGK